MKDDPKENYEELKQSIQTQEITIYDAKEWYNVFHDDYTKEQQEKIKKLIKEYIKSYDETDNYSYRRNCLYFS